MSIGESGLFLVAASGLTPHSGVLLFVTIPIYAAQFVKAFSRASLFIFSIL